MSWPLTGLCIPHQSTALSVHPLASVLVVIPFWFMNVNPNPHCNLAMNSHIQLSGNACKDAKAGSPKVNKLSSRPSWSSNLAEMKASMHLLLMQSGRKVDLESYRLPSQFQNPLIQPAAIENVAQRKDLSCHFRECRAQLDLNSDWKISEL